MGLAQISNLKERANKLVKINRLYSNKLKSVKEIKVLKFDYKNGEIPLWTDALVKSKRDKLIDFLKKNGVECRKFWYPLHQQKPFKEMIKNLSIFSVHKRIFWLPSSLKLTEKKLHMFVI